MNKLIRISQMLNDYPEGQIIFDEPVKVKIAGGLDFWVFGVCKDPESGVHVLDGNDVWHGQLLYSQQSGENVINSIYERMEKLTDANIIL